MVITLSCQISYIIMEFAGHISAHVNFLSLFSIDIDQWHHCNDALMVAQTVKHLSTMRETRVRSLGQEDPLEKEMAIHSVFLPGESQGQKSLVGYSPRGRKESDTTEQLHLHLSKVNILVVFSPYF